MGVSAEAVKRHSAQLSLACSSLWCQRAAASRRDSWQAESVEKCLPQAMVLQPPAALVVCTVAPQQASAGSPACIARGVLPQPAQGDDIDGLASFACSLLRSWFIGLGVGVAF